MPSPQPPPALTQLEAEGAPGFPPLSLLDPHPRHTFLPPCLNAQGHSLPRPAGCICVGGSHGHFPMNFRPGDVS